MHWSSKISYTPLASFFELKRMISVIIPVYKVEDYLDDCVQSVCNQTYSHLEIILVDDGSPDRCPQICDDWAKRDKRIKVIHKENGGLSDARNAGMDIATGEYIAFVDSDDYIAPTMYDIMIKGFAQSESIGIVSCQIFTDRGGVIEIFRDEWNTPVPFVLPSKDFAISKMLEKTSHCVWNKLFKRSLLNTVRFLKGRNNEDTLFMYELSKEIEKEGIDELIIPERFYYYRLGRQGSICASTTRPLATDMIDNLKYIIDDSMTWKHNLKQVIYLKYVNLLYEFFNYLYGKDPLMSLYYEKYKPLVRQVPVCYLWKHFNGAKRKHYIACRLFPDLRKYWLNLKG